MSAAARKIVARTALNRGTAVHVSNNRVRFIWPCGCKHIQTVGPAKRPLSNAAIRALVMHWRQNGVVLKQCEVHPDWYSSESQVARLNSENPQP